MVGEELRKVREAQGLTQEALAAKARMDRSFISEIERGEKTPSLDRLFRLCDALGVRASVIIARVERRRVTTTK